MLDTATPASTAASIDPEAVCLLRAIGSAIPLLQRWGMAAPEAFPADGVALLHEAGALRATLPCRLGGLGLGTEPEGAAACAALLAAIGEGSLPLGRVFEAHINAVRLIWRCGNAGHHRRLRSRLQEGALFALWVTDGNDASALRGDAVGGQIRLHGGKAFCSAAGHATDAVVIATLGEPQPQLLWLTLGIGEQVEASAIGLTGMAGSATGAVDFSGVTVNAEASFGAPGDYLREPDFSTGAWRGSAVAWGGLRALVTTVRSQLVGRARQHDPHQQARFGKMLIAVETARHFVLEAAQRGEAADDAAESAIAYVNLARIAVERACLDAMELAQRGLGLQAFVAVNPVSQVCRDLAVYLRQPAPDEVLANAASHGFAHAEFP
jgi:alkylation response protein AidB-like acyl-CoA dehydrogenase